MSIGKTVGWMGCGMVKVGAFLCLTMALGHGQTLFDNGTADANSPEGLYGDAGYQYTIAGDVFTPTLSGNADTVSFEGIYTLGIPSTDNFTLGLYSTSGGAPATLLSSSSLSNLSRVDTGIKIQGGAFELYSFTATLDTTFTLSSGSTYFLGVTNADSPTEKFALAIADVGNLTATDEYSYNTATSSFVGTPGLPLTFELSQSAVVATPEPSTWATLLAGLAGLAAYQFRRKSRA